MKFVAKTKIIRVRGGESYFKKWETDEGTRWEEMHKDLSALIPSCRDKNFKTMNSWSKVAKSFLEPVRPLPENFESDLLSPYARVEYAEGHKPLSPLRLR